MSFRARCPACGRKQSAEVSEVGQTVFCAACGARFVVEQPALVAESESDAGNTSIPDVDFFPPPEAPTPPPPLVTIPVARPVPQPIPLPPRQSAPVAPAPISSQVGISPPSQSSWLVPVIAVSVLLFGVTLAIGIAIGTMMNHSKTTAVPPPTRSPGPPVVQAAATPPVIVPVAPATEPDAVVVNNPIVPPRKPPPLVSAIKPTPPPRPEPPAKFKPVRPSARLTEDLDDQIGKSIDRGVNYLLAQFSKGQLKRYDPDKGETAGLDALAVYALLQAGEATHDLRLGPNTPLVAEMLDALKRMPMDKEDSTYSRSLRAAALGVYHRNDDKIALRGDSAWLIADSQNGAFSYQPLPNQGAFSPAGGGGPGARHLLAPPQFDGPWDNSNSQYGALGVWAALEAGVEVPNSFWQAVQKHWLSCQLPDGEWSYRGYGQMGRLSMTVAGITTLLVTEDQLDARAVVSTLGHQPFTPALQRGLNWLEAGDNSVRLPPYWRTYNLFGLERAALASGFKYFGTHDWYRELARDQMRLQDPNDGSWTDQDPIVGTAYTLLFLSRGRHPIFMNKLRFDGFWSNRPRDIANLSHFASTELERPINWQVVSLKSDWSDWMDSPVLYIASHQELKFSDDDVNKLRSFAENGGLIFTHADGDTPAFSKSVAELAKRLFPQYPMTDLPPTHPIYASLYKIKSQPKLQGISNGSRLLLVHSPTDLNKEWQQRDWVGHLPNFQMGMNVFIYAAGKANLRNRLKTPYVPEPPVTPILTTGIAQVRHLGDWNPEPAGLPRFARMFLGQTSVKVEVVDADPQTLDPTKTPLAHLTGTAAVRFNAAETKALHDYVDNGGTLLIDACGGSADFTNSIITDLLPHAFPNAARADLPTNDPILIGTGAGMSPVNLKLRSWRAEVDGATTRPLQYFTQGKGTVILSTVDLSTALLGTNTWPINGYEPDTAFDLTRNILLSILEK